MSTESGSLATQRAVCFLLSVHRYRQIHGMLIFSSVMPASIERSDVTKGLHVPIVRVVAQVCTEIPVQCHAPDH
jgi:hypothetical protein